MKLQEHYKFLHHLTSKQKEVDVLFTNIIDELDAQQIQYQQTSNIKDINTHIEMIKIYLTTKE
jgi:hypothetical protein